MPLVFALVRLVTASRWPLGSQPPFLFETPVTDLKILRHALWRPAGGLQKAADYNAVHGCLTHGLSKVPLFEV